MQKRNMGVRAAFLSAIFLGLAPVFGKQAILFGFHPLAVVGLRTLLATILLLVIMAVFSRKYFYIYPAGLIGCSLAGLFNGIGSLLYYSALGRINASLGQLLYSLYPLFVAIWLILDSQPPSRLTAFRLLLAMAAIYLLTNSTNETIDLIGVAQMLLAAVLYALHLPINQRVLYDIPAPTVTLYTLLAMSVVVFPAFLIFHRTLPVQAPWWPIIGLTFVTFLSRLALFMGVKHLGGMQTALLGLLELIVTVGFSILWLRESFSTSQWLGGVLLGLSILLVYYEPPTSNVQGKGGWLSWLRPPSSSLDPN
jgi:drug/metabolite transporter (DMT)-like permease